MSESLCEFQNINLRENLIVFVGSPLVDLIVKVDDGFMQKHHLQIDHTYPADSVDNGIFDELKRFRPIIEIGGSVTNTVRIFAQIANSPKSVTYFGTIGADDYGDMIEKQFVIEAIPNHLRKLAESPTGKVGVLLYRNGRTLITDLAASQRFADDFFEDNRDLFESSKYLYVSLLFIKVSYEIIEKIINFVEAKQKIVVINLGASFVPFQYPEETICLFKSADLVFGNEKEFRAFARINQISDNDLCEMLQEISRKFPKQNRIALLTRGERPVLVANAGKIQEFPVKTVGNVVDTNGAGDAFVGGFLAGFCQHKQLADCVEIGILAASKVIQKYGCNL